MRFLIFLLMFTTSACVSYSEKVRGARVRPTSENNLEAIALINEELKVSVSKHLPKEQNNDTMLLLLERATLLQAEGDYMLSARDFVYVDQHLGWFDPRKMSSVQLADYVYSANSSEYRAPASERLMINVQNMINFLVLDKLSQAKVEARRFRILTEYFEKNEEAFRPDILALGNYLAGVAFEKSAELEEAAWMYGRAWHFGIRQEELEHRLIDLFRVGSYKRFDVDEKLSGLDILKTKAKDLGPLKPSVYLESHRDDVLVLVQTGKVGHKVESEILVEDSETLSELNTDVNSINVAKMEGRTSGSSFELFLGYEKKEIAFRSEVGLEFERIFTSAQPAIYTAATARAASRHAMGEGANALGGDNPISALAGMAIKEGLNANDFPDTRSWSTAASTIFLLRTRWKSQPYRFATMSSTAGSESRVIEGNFPVINFSKLR